MLELFDLDPSQMQLRGVSKFQPKRGASPLGPDEEYIDIPFWDL